MEGLRYAALCLLVEDSIPADTPPDLSSGVKEPEVSWQRPRVRADCRDGERPCPWASCKHHLAALYLDDPEVLEGNFRALVETCALDVADRGDHTLEEVGDLFGVSRERIRQIEAGAMDSALRRLGKLREAAKDLGRCEADFLPAPRVSGGARPVEEGPHWAPGPPGLASIQTVAEGERFWCGQLRTSVTTTLCLARQAARPAHRERGRPTGGPLYPACAECMEGKTLRARLSGEEIPRRHLPVLDTEGTGVGRKVAKKAPPDSAAEASAPTLAPSPAGEATGTPREKPPPQAMPAGASEDLGEDPRVVPVWRDTPGRDSPVPAVREAERSTAPSRASAPPSRPCEVSGCPGTRSPFRTRLQRCLRRLCRAHRLEVYQIQKLYGVEVTEAVQRLLSRRWTPPEGVGAAGAGSRKKRGLPGPGEFPALAPRRSAGPGPEGHPPPALPRQQ